MLRQRGVDRNRLVAGEDAAREKTVPTGIGGELVVAVKEAVVDALFEPIDDMGGLAERDDAAHLDARPESQLDA